MVFCDTEKVILWKDNCFLLIIIAGLWLLLDDIEGSSD